MGLRVGMLCHVPATACGRVGANPSHTASRTAQAQGVRTRRLAGVGMMAHIVMGPVWRMTDETATALVNQLAEESFGFDATSRDAERNCWLVVHRHAHGVLPSEYDIREVPEELYLAVLARRRELS